MDTATNAAPTITKIVSVVDTRSYEEQGDRWVPIPGSGNEHECARCGRLHEVHAEVELSDGSVAIVGTGCMGSDSMAKAARSVARKAGNDRASQAKKLYQQEQCARLLAHPDMIAIRAESQQMIAAKNYFENAEYLARETAIYKRVHAEVKAAMAGFKVAA